MRYVIKFKNKDENAAEEYITIEEKFLKSQLKILVGSGYIVLSIRILWKE